ncbi:MAG: GSCFA domain-containing protein [Methylocella sp.]
MSRHPYTQQPTQAFWSKSVAAPAPSEVDPVGALGMALKASDNVATAGSCFAQHIARHLKGAGLGYLVTERGHALGAPDLEAFNYETFTARYGNIYTSRQLLQLFQRAYGTFHPKDDLWAEGPFRFVDPFRPQIQPSGFLSERELRLDRDVHLAAVREAFEMLDVLVFTLGLTECWRSREDGAVYPVCPGASGGTFDAERYEFVNLEVGDVVDDLGEFLRLLRGVNPGARMILTVSPVPLVATATAEHVLSATTYSKSVLRVAAEMMAKKNEGVAYFPSYEVITGSFNRGRYFAEDLRSVTEEGVSHVMRLFLKHLYGIEGVVEQRAAEVAIDAKVGAAERAIRVMCDEKALELQ